MRSVLASRRIAGLVIAALSFAVSLGLGTPNLLAADPQPYDVVLKPSGDASLDTAVHDSSSLITLKDKAAVGGFALVQRARSDADRFEEALRAYGYYKGTVTMTVGTLPIADPALVDAIDKAPAAPPLPITVSITPGPRFRLGRVTVVGTAPPEAVATLGLKPGQPALSAEVLAAKERLLAGLREASYPLAKVTMPDAVLHRDRDELDVAFQVEPGPKAALGQIAFEGLRDMSASFMRERLLLHPGQPFSPASIETAREDLIALGTFSSVRIVPGEQLDARGNLPLVIDVEERSLHAVDLGASWSTDLGVSLTAAWHHRNLFGSAEQLNITGAVQLGGDATTKPGGQFGVQFVKPGFLDRDTTLDVSLNAVKQSLVAYDQTALIERVGLSRKLSRYWSVQVGLLGEQEEITQEHVRRTYNFIGVPIGARYDSTKNLLDPVSGIRATMSITPTQSLGHPGGTYFITQVSGSTYLDLSSNGRSVVAVRAMAGQVSGAGVFGVPPDQRLYAGGSSSVRGYRYQSIGPKFADGKPTGGTAMSAGTVEFRQRFLESFGAAAFVDIGQASGDAKPFGSNWRAGAGAGLRYYTPIGPIRVDFAVPLIRERGGDSFEVYIGIGQAF